MVIQRQWRTSLSFGAGGASSGSRPAIAPLENTNQISSSDDSNESSSWMKKDVQNPEDSNKCPETVLKSLNERLSKSQVTEKGAMRSLELLRMNLQSSFDREIDTIVSKYKEKFFLAAYRNIKSNLGDSSISEEDLFSVLKKMVEKSGVQYSVPSTTKPRALCPASSNPGALFDLSDSETSLDTSPTLPLFNTTFQKYSPFPMWKSSMLDHQNLKRKHSPIFEEEPPTTVPPPTKKGYPPNTSSSYDILHSTLTRPSNSMSLSSASSAMAGSPFRPKVIWNTSAVTKDSRFVLDIEANKLFGVIDLRDRLTVKHPELIRYTPDNQDMEWLMNESVVPLAHRHTTIQLLLRDEVVKLRRAERQDENSAASDLPGFKVPDFMVRKMHKFFTELSVRRHKIRTNSGYFEMKFSDPKEDPSKPRHTSSVANPNSSLSSSHATLLSALLANCSSDGPKN